MSMRMSRREFLKKCRDISIAIAGSAALTPEIAEGFKKLSASGRPQVIFLQSQCCTGCSISATYGNEADFIDFITNIIRLQVHPNLSFSQGRGYMESIKSVSESGDFYLVCEGSVPAGMKEACIFNDEPMYDYLHKLMNKATAIISSGTCACFGGIPASNQNVTGAISIEDYMKRMKVNKPMIKIPGCPVQPDRLMGTVAYIVATGKLPDLIEGKPRKYFSELVHNQCGRYQAFNQGHYTSDFDKQRHSCLLKNGCRGPVVYADCPTRRWNGKVNVCIESNTPCIGCIHDDFPFNSPLYLAESSFKDLSWSEMKAKMSK
ncbi:MAG: hydrogenase small subunit [Deferribacterales bacterium]